MRSLLGLVKFALLLCCLLLPVIRRKQIFSPEKIRSESKYAQILNEPSTALVAPDEVVFCPKCHVAVATIKHTDEGTQIIRKGHVVMAISGMQTKTSNGEMVNGFPIQCPNGHQVIVEDAK